LTDENSLTEIQIMKNKVTIIGAGSVGATVAYTLVATGSVAEIVLIDVNVDKAKGEAMDILQATPYLSPTKIYCGTYEDAADSDIVIITSGVGRKPGQSRIDLTQTNVNILKSIAPQIVKYAPDALYLFVANPVDILTYVFCKITGVPSNRVIGTGCTLDSIRLRTKLSELYSVNQKQVHAYVLGEHGDSSFVAWSAADISGIPLDEYNEAITK
jgi:L-lactate dehydrogenase